MQHGLYLLDGAIGTSLWEKSDNKNPVWTYNVDNPAIVAELHKEYIEAGSDMILANTFCANRPTVSHYGGYDVHKIVSTGVRIAKEVAAGRVKVGLSVGPLPSLLKPYGPLSHEEAAEIYAEQIGSGMEEHADFIYAQTFFDLTMIKIAAEQALRFNVPVFCSLSFEKRNRTIMGNTVQQVVDTLVPLGITAVGLNCSLGPDAAIPVIKLFHEATDLPLIFKPNAGTAISGEHADQMKYYDAETFTNELLPAVDLGVKYIGGCCGSNASYIRLLNQKLAALDK